MRESTALVLLGIAIVWITGPTDWPRGGFSILLRAAGDLLVLWVVLRVRRSP